MPLPAEVLFHRFFTNELSPSERLIYRGKADLDRLEGSLLPASLLAGIQEMFNGALANEKKGIKEHVEHGIFHFDYVDSDHPNAMAFNYEGYSFIGITVSLLNLLWNVSFKLSRFEDTPLILGLDADVSRDLLQVVLLRLQVSFVVSHEWTHHVHGHTVTDTTTAVFAEEVDTSKALGSLASQAREVDADGYAVYYGLEHLFAGGERVNAVEQLGLASKPAEKQDEVLLACFVIALAGFTFVRPPQEVTASNVYTFTHPPPGARLHMILTFVKRWCGQSRPLLDAWLNPLTFRGLFASAAIATWGMNGGDDWSSQIKFLASDVGASYLSALNKNVNALIDAL